MKRLLLALCALVSLAPLAHAAAPLYPIDLGLSNQTYNAHEDRFFSIDIYAGTDSDDVDFDVGYLPKGLKWSKHEDAYGEFITISGYPEHIGFYRIDISATDGYTSDSGSFFLDVNPAPASIYAPGRVGAVKDVYTYIPVYVDGTEPITVHVYNLPDGMSYNEIEQVIEGYPANEGDYSVRIDASNKAGTDTVYMQLRVRKLNDANANGMPDELDAVMGDVTGGSGPASTQELYRLGNGALRINFTKSDSDSVTLKGIVATTVGQLVEGTKVGVSIGGKAFAFTLDAKGKATSGTAKITVKNMKNGLFSKETGAFTITVRKDSVSAELSDDGFVQSVKGQILLPVDLFFGTNLYTSDILLGYKANSKAGSATKAKYNYAY